MKINKFYFGNFYFNTIFSTIMVFTLIFFLIPSSILAEQDAIVEWNFLDQNPIADAGIPSNLTKTIGLSFTPGSLTYPQGTGASGTFAISANSWATGSGTKWWEVEFTTTGYKELKISFAQRSSATGPRDFNLQYKIGNNGSWTNLAGGSITLGNAIWFNSPDYLIPSEASNHESLYIRWAMTSNTATNGGTVAPAGTNRITNIVIEGEEIMPAGSITVNKSSGSGIYPDQVFNFEINTSPVQTASITGSGTAEFSGLAAGTYTISETTTGFNTKVSPDNSTWSTGKSIEVSISGDLGNEDLKDVYFQNDIISSIGSITVNKTIGTRVDTNQFFSFRINTSPAQTARITGSGTAEFSGLSAGNYIITETTTGFNTQVSPDNSTWSTGKSIEVTISGNIGSEDSKSVYFQNEEDPDVEETNIVNWNFLDEDQVADGGISENLNKTISLSFAPAIFTYYAGPGGGQTKAIAADSWNNGVDDKNWMVEFCTENYSDLKLSFSQRSSATGPRDFNLQFKIGESGSWVTFDSFSLPGDSFLNVFNLSLPSEVYSQPSVFLRWIMSSNTSAREYDEVGLLGTNRISNIFVSVGNMDSVGQIGSPLSPEDWVLRDLNIDQLLAHYGSAPEGFAKMLYDTILGRVLDEDGLNYWTEQLIGNTFTGSQIVEHFIFSDEIIDKVVEMSNEEFITFLYKSFLSRTPDSEGYESWLNYMNSGVSKSDTLKVFMDNEEWFNICSLFNVTP